MRTFVNFRDNSGANGVFMAGTAKLTSQFPNWH